PYVQADFDRGTRPRRVRAVDIIRIGMRKFPPSRAALITALVLATAVPLCAVLVVAQTQRRAAAQPPPAPKPATPFDAAMRSLIEGRYDEVDVQAAALNSADP